MPNLAKVLCCAACLACLGCVPSPSGADADLEQPASNAISDAQGPGDSTAEPTVSGAEALSDAQAEMDSSASEIALAADTEAQSDAAAAESADDSFESADDGEGPSDSADVEDPDAELRYTYSEDHDPNGIGKFYMGREIAMVMGHQGIAWLERPEREQEEGLSLLIECLDIEPGSTVADIGAGSGVITTRLCEAVGEEGTVVAVDIQQEMLDALQLNMHQAGHRNVELVLGTVESPRLEPDTVDLVVMVDVYHEFDHPYEMLLNISQSLRPGGRVVFVEYRKEDPTVPIKEIHKMTEAQVRLEAEQPEFQLEYVETVDDLPRQHVIVFRRMEMEVE